MEVRRRYRADPATLAPLRKVVHEFATRLGFSSDAAQLIGLGVSEAAANAVEHSGSPTYDVRLHDRTGGIEIMVFDGGVFAPDGLVRDAGRDRYGMSLMTAIFDSVELHKGTLSQPGTRVLLTTRLV